MKKLLSAITLVGVMALSSVSAFAASNVPIGDGIDLGQFQAQPRAASYNYTSSSFSSGVNLNGGTVFNIQNTPKFTSAKQSTTSDKSCSIAYQIIDGGGNYATKTVDGAYVNTSTTVSGFDTRYAKGDCSVYLANKSTGSTVKASGTFNY